jgi:hypothetical protein
MSSVSKETPVVEEKVPPPSTTAEETTTKTTDDATPAATATAVETDNPKGAAASTVFDKPTKIFGSFTTETPTKKDESKESTPSRPIFGGFGVGTSSASAWSAPTTLGGFGAASSFTSKKEEDDQEEDGAADEAPESPDVHFEPLVKLEEVQVTTNEEEESVEFKMYHPLPDGV